ncbi:MAG: anti-sigma factor family protein [Spirochaetota bacterium]
MNHIPVHKLSEYIDGILDVQEKDAIESHIAECSECRQNLQQLQKMVSLLSSLKTMSIPTTFSTHTLARVKNQYYKKRYYHSIRGSFIAAAIVLIAIITMLPDSIKHDQFKNPIVQNIQNNNKFDCIIPTNMDLNTAMMVIQQHQARVLDYSNSYIIVESDVNSFSSIRQILNNYENYRRNTMSNVGINYMPQGDTKYPQLSHANKKKYIFRLQLR